MHLIIAFSNEPNPFIQPLHQIPLLTSAKAFYQSKRMDSASSNSIIQTQNSPSSLAALKPGATIATNSLHVSTTVSGLETTCVSHGKLLPAISIRKRKMESAKEEVVELTALPGWQGLKDTDTTVQMPMNRDEKIKIILNKAGKRFYSTIDPKDSHLPAIIHRDQKALCQPHSEISNQRRALHLPSI